MGIRTKKYRVVKDYYGGCEAQVWRIWWPFWVEMNFCNTHFSLEEAINYIKKDNKVVWRS